ncbi:hypothetical protein AMAG_03462 [Allomyces macrogynus ATCC 38327]|uniref:RNA helicase n=1 Tax=Allomyces macrogynus (strain ATCC 38327) TaxID=578462 RepID=A0A0L0S9Q8_ALLM3|nr:hypothetical protein AMAG_03462 [Allomyces macrogynus ATCC 38327]|eukprot:KNE59125.1 hypothetical protein AMAG_03462 [Allomyces macrogynus ATCC 38327]
MAPLDFGPGTIADDQEIQAYDTDSDSERILQTAPKKTKKGKKGADGKDDKGSAKAASKDLNPDFTFSLDSVSASGQVHPWDFSEARAKLRQRSIQYTSIDEKIAKRVKSAGNDDEDEEEEDVAGDVHESMDVDAAAAGSDADDGASGDEDGEGDGDGDEDSEGDDDEDADSDEEDVIRDRERAAKAEQRKLDFFEIPTQPDDDDLPTNFAGMNLSRPVIKGLTHLGFTAPTVIQARTIPLALMGKDIVGGAVTGSGKTLAFMIPILERLLFRPKANPVTRVLVLTPTRELAIQCHSVATKVSQFTDITIALAVGGLNVKQQEAELKKRPDIVIATPGRLIDFLHNSASFTLDTIEILVMDEADRMLEDGFADELNEIVKSAPKSRQTMLFSATMTDNIDQLIRLSLTHPVRLFVDSRQSTSHRLIQEFVRVRPNREDDRPALLLALCKRSFKSKTVVFFKSKAAAHQMKILFGLNGLNAAELHGNLTQEMRLDALEKFRDGEVDYLLATDLAARGIDVKGIETVVNYNMPTMHVQYLHRVGRTARAGRGGRAVSLVGEADRKLLRLIIKHATSADQIRNRVIPAAVVDKYAAKVEDAKEDIKAVLDEEKEEKQLRQTEQQLQKAQNMVDYRDEILARPKREWFQSSKDRAAAKEASAKDLGLDSGDKGGDGAESKKRRNATDGLSRRKKRRMMSMEEEGLQRASMGAIKKAKKDSRPGRLHTVSEGGSGGSGGSRGGKKIKGFESDLAGGSRKKSGGGGAGGAKRAGGKGKAMAKIKNKAKGKGRK